MSCGIILIPMKKKVVVGIFAHPDDEAFGPGGTLALFAKEKDVYVICATSGETATGTTDATLGKERREELRKSCADLGVKEVFFLDYIDGTLCNNLYHEIAEKVTNILEKLQPETLITFEPRGVSGHIDHITMSMITQFIFPKIPSVKKTYDALHALCAESGNAWKIFYLFPIWV